MAVDYSRSALAAAAGVDPWSLAEQVCSGDPSALQQGALRLRQAGLLAADAVDVGDRADRALASAFHRSGFEVFDAAATTRQSAVLLADRGEKIEETARAALDVASALSDAAASAAAQISGLNSALLSIVGLQATGPDEIAAAAAAADQRYFQMAVDAVRSTGSRIGFDLDAYNAVLVNRTARMSRLGYGLPPAGGAAELADDSLRALGEAALDNPEAVVGVLAGLGLVLAGAGVIAGGAGVTAGTGGLAVPVGGPAVAGGWALLGIGGALLAASANEIAHAAATKHDEPSVEGGSGTAPDRTLPSRRPDPAAEPSGRAASPNPKDNAEKVRGLQRQNESARILAKAGYAVEQLPESKVQGEKNPDFRIEGQIFDNYAPSGGRTHNFANRIQDKVDDNQT
ncbi:MAG TPA: hypothetical protein VNA11_04380, partial [Pseudonocardia sp.]|nr:hypothetical protein [Pseudonocardia sp.]